MGVWLIILELVIKFGPTIMGILIEIWDLIKKKSDPERSFHTARFKALMQSAKRFQKGEMAAPGFVSFRDELLSEKKVVYN